MSAKRSSTPSSLTSTQHLRAPTIRPSVITTPPWARDEPPSPTLEISSSELALPNPPESGRPSDVASYNSTLNPPSRWWTFTSRRPRDPSLFNYPQQLPDELPSPARSEKRPFKFPIPQSVRYKEESSSATPTPLASRRNRSQGSRGLSLTLPAPPQAFTLSHQQTPGWNTPWTSRPGAQGPFEGRDDDDDAEPESFESSNSHGSIESGRTWKKRRKRFRSFILHNTYVPLLFRFVNLSFTASALALAVRIRDIERDNNAMGIIGSSPTIVIIFAPLTIVHVMAAVYLEYFGRPLGLWQTSGKMFHTLLEVVFICAWSAALSLCFDNFFTSLIPCASASHISWYNSLPRPTVDLTGIEGTPGDTICDNQLALICLVTVGLITYCINLVISLFRIVEKVKYHPVTTRNWRPS